MNVQLGYTTSGRHLRPATAGTGIGWHYSLPAGISQEHTYKLPGIELQKSDLDVQHYAKCSRLLQLG